MENPNATPNPKAPAELSCTDLLGLGLYVIEAKHRSRDKNLGPWKVVAAFVEREDAYSFFGKYHQGRTARVLSPNAEVSEGWTRDSRIKTAAQSRPSLH
jgi:hypothetical protein